MKIYFKADETTNKIVNPYDETKGDTGLHKARLVQESVVVDTVTGFTKLQERSFTLKGPKKLLEDTVKSYEKRPIEGHIIRKEYLESEVPESVINTLVTGNKTYEEAIAYSIKRAGKDGPVLTCNGERIITVTSWDRTGLDSDILVKHDNKDEVKDYMATRDSQAVLATVNP